MQQTVTLAKAFLDIYKQLPVYACLNMQSHAHCITKQTQEHTSACKHTQKSMYSLVRVQVNKYNNNNKTTNKNKQKLSEKKGNNHTLNIVQCCCC